MKQRKHRFYIDVTYSKPVEYREAAKGLSLTLDNKLDLTASPVWAYDTSPYIDKLVIVEKTR
jgi:hypothetical protein